MTRLENVNTTDIRDAVQLACQTMTRGFNRHDSNHPFFSAFIRPVARLGWSGHYSDAHVPGRHLNALVAANRAMGVEIDGRAVRKHADALHFSFSGEVPLPLNRATIAADRPTAFLAHNLREGFHGLYALMQWDEDGQAFALAGRAIDFINRNWDPVAGWSIQESPSGFGPNHVVSGAGRAIGPLVKIHNLTQHRPALELAQKIAGAALDAYPPDGRFLGDRLGTHVHSITSTMSSLAQLAEATGDDALLQRVATFYDHGLWQIRDELGWAIESTLPQANPDRGEVNTSGDILETALILGAQLDATYFGDAERILRCHVLPSQLRDISFARGSAGVEAVSLPQHSVAVRLHGAWGFPAPYGHEPLDLQSVSFNLDIVGGTVGSLCEFYRRAVVHDGEGGYTLNCLLDLDEPKLRLQTPYVQDRLTIRLNEAGNLAIRVPAWFGEDPVTFAGKHKLRHENGYWLGDRLEFLEMKLPLAEREVVLRHRTRDIRAKLAGDAVVAMENHGADLVFFESY